MFYVALCILYLTVLYFLLAKKYNWFVITSFLFVELMPGVPLGHFVLQWTGFLLLPFLILHFIFHFVNRGVSIRKNVRLRTFNMSITLFMVFGIFTAYYYKSTSMLLGTPMLEFMMLVFVNYYAYIVDSEATIDWAYVIKYYAIGVIGLNFLAVVMERVVPGIISPFIIKYYGAKGGAANVWVQRISGSSFGRVTGLALMPVTLGGQVCAMMFFVLPFVKVKFRYVLYLLITIMGVLSFSKTAILAMVIGAFFYVPRYFFQLKKAITVGILSLILIVAVAESNMFKSSFLAKVVPSNASEMFSLIDIINKASTERYDTDNSSADQVGNIKEFEQHPVFGIGYANAEDTFLGDSSYTTLLVLNGLVGMGILLLSYVIIYFSAPMGSIPRAVLFGLCLVGFALKTYDNYFFVPYYVIILANRSRDIFVQKRT